MNDVEPADISPPPDGLSRDDPFLAFNRLPVPAHSMGPEGRLLRVNDAWVAYTGYTREEAAGRSFAEFLDAPSAERYLRQAVPELIGAVPAQETRSVEYRLIRRSGDIADVVLTARPEREPGTGRFLRSLSVLIDITARNRAEAALRQAQKLEALGSLTGGVAHDFNNLLAAILGSLELLAKRLPPGDARAARLLDAALQGARRGEALTGRLLAFSRQQDLAPRPIDLRRLLDELHPLLRQLVGPRIELERSVRDDVWALQADPNQLELALLNLAANARDAMPQGGRLHVAARNTTVLEQAVTGFFTSPLHPPLTPGDYVVVCVRDTGIGMDETALGRATDPFFTTKGVGKGTGLGLSMVHGFALQSGGALRLTSQVGSGTTAQLWLPRTTEPVTDAVSATDGGVTAGAPRGLRVLLVDDDPLVVISATAMLEDLGHQDVTVAASGDAALAILRRDGNFDVLLTDYMMPGMSGMQLAEAARALHPSLPILLASGFAELDGFLGMDLPRLRKPFNLNGLAEALAALPQRTRPAGVE